MSFSRNLTCCGTALRGAPLDHAWQEDTGGPVVVEESYWMMGEYEIVGAMSSF